MSLYLKLSRPTVAARWVPQSLQDKSCSLIAALLALIPLTSQNEGVAVGGRLDGRINAWTLSWACQLSF